MPCWTRRSTTWRPICAGLRATAKPAARGTAPRQQRGDQGGEAAARPSTNVKAPKLVALGGDTAQQGARDDGAAVDAPQVVPSTELVQGSKQIAVRVTGPARLAQDRLVARARDAMTRSISRVSISVVTPVATHVGALDAGQRPEPDRWDARRRHHRLLRRQHPLGQAPRLPVPLPEGRARPRFGPPHPATPDPPTQNRLKSTPTSPVERGAYRRRQRSKAARRGRKASAALPPQGESSSLKAGRRGWLCSRVRPGSPPAGEAALRLRPRLVRPGHASVPGPGGASELSLSLVVAGATMTEAREAGPSSGPSEVRRVTRKPEG